jgi:hypothetical protein
MPTERGSREVGSLAQLEAKERQLDKQIYDHYHTKSLRGVLRYMRL